MKKVSGLIALLIAMVMLVTLFGCGAASQKSDEKSATTASAGTASEQSTQPAKLETIQLSIFQNGFPNITATGVQTDPVAKYIEEKLGIQMDFPYLMSGQYEQQLNAMIASNDLPDIILMQNITDVTKTMTNAINAKAIIPLDDLLKDNAPNFTANPDLKSRLDFFTKFKSPDGKLYCLPLGGGLANPLTGPELGGNYIRWDVYKKIGYPEVASQDELLNTLAAMQKAEPASKDGKKVYAVGAWFGDAQGWGDWIFQNLPILSGNEILKGYTGVFDISANNILGANAIADTNSPLWQAVKWFYNAKQLGILDPDSYTQKYDQYVQKVNTGRYLWTFPGWVANPAYGELAKAGYGSDAGFVPLPPLGGTDKMVTEWIDPLGNEPYAISANCKYPERAIQLLDYFASEEGSRIIYNGVKSQTWDVIDGKPQIKPDVMEKYLAMSPSDLVKEYGASKYTPFAGYSNTSISKNDNEPMNLTSSSSVASKSYTPFQKDAFDYYGVKSYFDLLQQKGVKSIYDFSTYSYNNIGSLPEELAKKEGDLKNYLSAQLVLCVRSKDDADFKANQEKVIKEVEKYNVNDLFSWYQNRFTQLKQDLDPIMAPYVNK